MIYNISKGCVFFKYLLLTQGIVLVPGNNNISFKKINLNAITLKDTKVDFLLWFETN